MAQPLDYAHRSNRHRNRILLIITIMAIALSLFLARPKIKALRDRQNRRAAICKQFDAQLQVAQKALDENALDRAGNALFDAEFPARTEAKLFWTSEINSFDQRIKPLRQRLDQLALIAEQKRNAQPIIESEPPQGAVDDRSTERRTIIVDKVSATSLPVRLESIAAQQLRAGNASAALAICRQIIDLDPAHHFDKTFWSNAR